MFKGRTSAEDIHKFRDKEIIFNEKESGLTW